VTFAVEAVVLKTKEYILGELATSNACRAISPSIYARRCARSPFDVILAARNESRYASSPVAPHWSLFSVVLIVEF
jgi:hypothetical protein